MAVTYHGALKSLSFKKYKLELIKTYDDRIYLNSIKTMLPSEFIHITINQTRKDIFDDM